MSKKVDHQACLGENDLSKKDHLNHRSISESTYLVSLVEQTKHQTKREEMWLIYAHKSYEHRLYVLI